MKGPGIPDPSTDTRTGPAAASGGIPRAAGMIILISRDFAALGRWRG
jgi:hypothetical protein